MFQQEASFQAAAAAVLDQDTLWTEKGAHLLRVSPHNREFCPRQCSNAIAEDLPTASFAGHAWRVDSGGDCLLLSHTI
jgi:hypothetical protein